jgi:hypothetical protein
MDARGEPTTTFSRIPRTWSLFSLTFTFKGPKDAIDILLIEYGDCSPALVNRTAIPFHRPTVSFYATIAVVVGKDEIADNYHTVGNDFRGRFALAWVPGITTFCTGEARGSTMGDDETVITPDDADELRKLARLDSAQE